MNNYVTGQLISNLRKKKKLTQLELAEKLNVSDKTISKWETGKGFPDISLVEPLAKALDVSLIELLSGQSIQNTNKHANMLRSHFHVCPICANVIVSSGEAIHSCCGIQLPSLEVETIDDKHTICVEKVEDEYLISINHPMTKTHYISFFAAKRNNGVEIIKLYPEQEAQARFKILGTQKIYAYCTHHGLFEINPRKKYKDILE
ncbi:MAG: helix-turn-helix domain-containing protein [Bacillota bacterium]|nr:helix-turn-helix domain-containing protein [Bacillota bacterium]